MTRYVSCALMVCALLVSGVANAQQGPSLGTLIADGYQVQAMTAADLQPGDATQEQNIFIIVQKDGVAFGCALQTMSNSFCERIQ